MLNLKLLWLRWRLTKWYPSSVCLCIFNMVYSIYFISIQAQFQSRLKSGLWHDVVWQMVPLFQRHLLPPYSVHPGTTLHVVTFENTVILMLTTEHYKYLWSVVNVFSCSHTEFSALCLSCKIKSVTFSLSWDKTLPETSRSLDYNGIYRH